VKAFSISSTLPPSITTTFAAALRANGSKSLGWKALVD
jgi:hypothetical protein